MTSSTDDILDDLFHWVAFTAFVQVAREQKAWPDSDAVRQRAYRYYEDILAEKNAAKDAGQA